MYDDDNRNTRALKCQWAFCYYWGSQSNDYEVVCSVASRSLAEIY